MSLIPNNRLRPSKYFSSKSNLNKYVPWTHAIERQGKTDTILKSVVVYKDATSWAN